jgi:hypothetical protein
MTDRSRLLVAAALLALIPVGAAPAAAQSMEEGFRWPATTLGVVFGLSDVPGGFAEPRAHVGVRGSVAVWRFLSVRGEYGAWVDTPACVQPHPSPPCGQSGTGWLVGPVVSTPAGERVGVRAGVSAGRFARNAGGSQQVRSTARSFEVGGRLALHRGLSLTVDYRRMGAADPDFKVWNRELEYRLGQLGLEYRLGR